MTIGNGWQVGYEADPDKRHDLRQEIHLQLWKSFQGFDGRCSLKTWTFRVAHNAAVSHLHRERRKRLLFVSLEELEQSPYQENGSRTSTRAGRSNASRG